MNLTLPNGIELPITEDMCKIAVGSVVGQVLSLEQIAIIGDVFYKIILAGGVLVLSGYAVRRLFDLLEWGKTNGKTKTLARRVPDAKRSSR